VTLEQLDSVRKELKVRPGFTPEEDKARYRSTGARETSRLKGFVPGATSRSSATYGKEADVPGPGDFPALGSAALTPAQRKNQKRRDKKKMEKELEEAKGWDSEEEEDEQPQVANGADLAETQKVEAADAAEEDVNADSKEALRHLIQQSVSANPAPPSRPTPSASTAVPSSSTSVAVPPPAPKEKKDPRPGGLFAAALKGSTATGSEDSDSNLSKGMDKLDVGSQGDKNVKSKSSLDGQKSETKPSEPALSSAPIAAQSRPKQKPTKPVPPGSSSGGSNPKKPSSTTKTPPTGSPARQRSEVRVRPGGGLAGMMKQIAEQNAK